MAIPVIAEPPDVRLWLLAHIRKGRSLLGYISLPTSELDEWVQEASRFLEEHATRAEAESFLTAASPAPIGHPKPQLEAHMAALEKIAQNYSAAG